MSVGSLRWPPSHWTLRARITALATVVVGVLLVAATLAFFYVIRAMLYDNLAERGERALADLSRQVQDGRAAGELPHEIDGFHLLQVLSADGRVLAATPELKDREPLALADPPADGRTVTVRATVPGSTEDIYLIARRVKAPDGERVVYAGAVLTQLRQVKGVFVLGLGLVTVLGAGLVALLVWRAVGRALRPVAVMRAELAAITGGVPDGRVTVPRGGDEVAGLAESVNLTLGRLDRVMERQRAFVGDVSHELRSPLTGLRTQLEVALEYPEDEDWPEVARTALTEADRLQSIVTDLLIMARLDAGVPQVREEVDLAVLVRAELARRRTDRVPVELAAADGVTVLGSRAQLERVLTNLLDNGVRHAATCVRVTVAAEDGEAVLRVADDGAGVAEADREAVFRRFHRLSEGRRRDGGGTGLGLPISRDVAAAHGGTLAAVAPGGPEDTFGEEGARLELRLPLSVTDKNPPVH